MDKKKKKTKRVKEVLKNFRFGNLKKNIFFLLQSQWPSKAKGVTLQEFKVDF